MPRTTLGPARVAASVPRPPVRHLARRRYQDRIGRAADGSRRVRALHPRPRGRRFRARVRRLLRRQALHRRRERHRRASRSRCARWASAPGDEVVVPSFTFYASVEATVNAGATPVFCDVDPATFCVTARDRGARDHDRTRKAIVAVDLFGWLPPLDELRELGLPVLEDAAQAHGARRDGRRSGTYGDAATFSFFPSKNLGCLGDGGAIVTRRRRHRRALARRLRFHGSTDKVTYTEVGYNSRLDELQAACCACCCPSSTAGTPRRRAAAPRLCGRRPGRRRGTLPASTTARARLPPVRGAPPRRRRAGRAAGGAGRRRPRATTAVPVPPPARDGAVRRRPPTFPAPPRRPHASRPADGHELSAEQVDEVIGRVRIWVDLTNSPHVLVMRPLIEAMREDGHEVEVTARDFAQTLQLLERFGMEHTAIGRHRGGGLGDKGLGLFAALARARALGARAGLRRRHGPRLERRDAWPPSCSASRARRRSTTSGPRSSTTSTAGCARAVVVPDAIPPERLVPLRRAREGARRTRG